MIKKKKNFKFSIVMENLIEEKGFGRLTTIQGLEQFDEFDEPSRSEFPILVYSRLC